MSKRKTFTSGQVVEVQRDVGKPWESATYGGPVADMRGWHRVTLHPSSPPRYICYDTGIETGEARGDTFETWRVLVPTQRLRAQVETKGALRTRSATSTPTSTQRALVYLFRARINTDGVSADDLGCRLWPDRVGRAGHSSGGGGDYPAQMLLGRMRKAGLVRVTHAEGSSRWELTMAGNQAAVRLMQGDA